MQLTFTEKLVLEAIKAPIAFLQKEFTGWKVTLSRSEIEFLSNFSYTSMWFRIRMKGFEYLKKF